VRFQSVCVCLGGVLISSLGAAKSGAFEPAALSWVRADDAASCPGGIEVARAVEDRLGAGALVSITRATLVVEASIRARAEGGFHVDIALARGDVIVGRRELESADADCANIAAQAVLVITLTIDPEASALAPPAEQPVPPPPIDDEPPPTPAKPREKPTHEAASKAPESPPWGGDLELATGIATGIVPEITPGLFVRGRARPPSLPFMAELETGYFPPRSVDAAPGRGASFQVFMLGAAICNRPDRRLRLRATICAGPDFAAVTGSGYGYELTPHFSSWTMMLTARGRLGFRVARGFSTFVGPDVMVPFGRDRFQAVTPAGTEELFRMSAVAFGFEFGGVWEL
jgi:hypothetical protein